MKEISSKYNIEIYAKQYRLLTLYNQLKQLAPEAQQDFYNKNRDEMISCESYLSLIYYKFKKDKALTTFAKEKLNLIPKLLEIIQNVTKKISLSQEDKETFLVYAEQPSFAPHETGQFKILPKKSDSSATYEVSLFNEATGEFDFIQDMPVAELQFKAKLLKNDFMEVYFDFPKGLANGGQPDFDLIFPADFLNEVKGYQSEVARVDLSSSSSSNESSPTQSASNSDEESGFDSEGEVNRNSMAVSSDKMQEASARLKEVMQKQAALIDQFSKRRANAITALEQKLDGAQLSVAFSK